LTDVLNWKSNNAKCMNTRAKSSALVLLLILMFVFPSHAIGGNQISYQGSTVNFPAQTINLETDEKINRALADCEPEEEDLLDSPSNVFRTRIRNLRTETQIRVLIYSIDFSDRASNLSDFFDFEDLKLNLSNFFSAVSARKISFVWTYETTVTRMPRAIGDYDAGSRTKLNQIVQVIHDAQLLAIQKYSLENYDYMIIKPPSTIRASDISTSISVLGTEREKINATILAYDFWKSGQSWTIPAHEIGHALGLVDLYSYFSAIQVAIGLASNENQFQFMGVYDLMNWPTGSAPEFMAWNRIQLGFLAKNEIVCLTRTYTQTKLRALESQNSGVKALIYKINEHQLIVIENRQQLGFDRKLSASDCGIIVYAVNLRIQSGYGPARLISPIHRKTNEGPALHMGESMIVAGLKIKYASSTSSQILVQTEKI
jgi:M6 family metalloprotease-like protein